MNKKKRPSHVVIGLGNEIMGDDGLGIVAAKKIGRLLKDVSEVEVISLPWAGFYLLDELIARKKVAIVDCFQTLKNPPGTIFRLDEKDFRGSVRLNSFHDIDYLTVLELGRRLGHEMPSKISIWGIEGEIVNEFSEEISPGLYVSIDQVVQEVLEFFDLEIIFEA